MRGYYVPPVTYMPGQSGISSYDAIPSIEAYEAFCREYLETNRTSKKSIFYEPKKLRRLALAARDGDISNVAKAYGRTSSWLTGILAKLPETLR